jgi:DNA/RNA-binding domain of Phe-tRNA-synthetase-like protein
MILGYYTNKFRIMRTSIEAVSKRTRKGQVKDNLDMAVDFIDEILAGGKI